MANTAPSASTSRPANRTRSSKIICEKGKREKGKKGKRVLLLFSPFPFFPFSLSPSPRRIRPNNSASTKIENAILIMWGWQVSEQEAEVWEFVDCERNHAAAAPEVEMADAARPL